MGGDDAGVASSRAIRELEGGATLPKIGKRGAVGGAFPRQGCAAWGPCFCFGFLELISLVCIRREVQWFRCDVFTHEDHMSVLTPAVL